MSFGRGARVEPGADALAREGHTHRRATKAHDAPRGRRPPSCSGTGIELHEDIIRQLAWLQSEGISDGRGMKQKLARGERARVHVAGDALVRDKGEARCGGHRSTAFGLQMECTHRTNTHKTALVAARRHVRRGAARALA